MQEPFEKRKHEAGHDGGLVDKTEILYELVIDRVNSISQKYNELDARVLALFNKAREVNSEYTSEVDKSKKDSRALMLSVISQFIENQEKHIGTLEVCDNNVVKILQTGAICKF